LNVSTQTFCIRPQRVTDRHTIEGMQGITKLAARKQRSGLADVRLRRRRHR